MALARTRPIEPVIRFVAIITADPAAERWARARIASQWGELREVTESLPFHAGGYYGAEMGPDLRKVIVALKEPCDPAGLADWKQETNAWERQAAAERVTAHPRPINLDPGYLTQAKLVLATVKDRDHRIYLRDGIFAEVTLTYTAKRWVGHRWTYPDYCTSEVIEFATACRQRLRRHLRQTGGFRIAKKNSFLQADEGGSGSSPRGTDGVGEEGTPGGSGEPASE